MPSPFPGVDPFIEASGRGLGFHNILIGHCSELLNARLPENYLAVVDERLELVEVSDEGRRRHRRPDVAVVHDTDSSRRAPAGTLAAAIEPVSVTLPDYEEIAESYIEIVSLPDQELVTSIEILSPTNKSRADGGDYLAKRAALIRRGINLVEIDLLLGGERLPTGDVLPPGDFYAFVSRRQRRPKADVYAWSIRQPIPPVPIPLKSSDEDAVLDLAAAFKMTYDHGRYHKGTRYNLPLPLTLSESDRAWVMHQLETMPK